MEGMVVVWIGRYHPLDSTKSFHPTKKNLRRPRRHHNHRLPRRRRRILRRHPRHPRHFVATDSELVFDRPHSTGLVRETEGSPPRPRSNTRSTDLLGVSVVWMFEEWTAIGRSNQDSSSHRHLRRYLPWLCDSSSVAVVVVFV